jgi:hypothetical protein
MSEQRKSMDQRLLEARIVIDNSLSNQDILDKVTLFGYDQERLQAALALYHNVIDLIMTQRIEYGEQYEATNTLQAAWDTADAAYKRTLKISRLVFEGNAEARNALGLNGRRKTSIGGWIEQTMFFYKAMLETPAFIAAMTPYSYDQAKLSAENALVQAVIDAKSQQNTERGQAQEATKARDAKMDELDQWISAYKIVAEVALDESPQKLEQLGWIVPS